MVTGNALGPLLGYEVLTAFFPEATFPGIMLVWLEPGAGVAACLLRRRCGGSAPPSRRSGSRRRTAGCRLRQAFEMRNDSLLD